MKGAVILGRTNIFEIQGWTNVGPVHTFTGRLIIYARKLPKGFRTRIFKIHLKGEDIKDSVRLRGTIQKCLHNELVILSEK
jgi:hypothetical protein